MNIYPKEGYLKSGDHRLHYLLWGGSGPKLVFLHSMGMDAHGFDNICEALHGGYQILTLDILDHGDSDTPKDHQSLPAHSEIMRDCYRQLGFWPNVLIGHSVGGMMGMVLLLPGPVLQGIPAEDVYPVDHQGIEAGLEVLDPLRRRTVSRDLAVRGPH